MLLRRSVRGPAEDGGVSRGLGVFVTRNGGRVPGMGAGERAMGRLGRVDGGPRASSVGRVGRVFGGWGGGDAGRSAVGGRRSFPRIFWARAQWASAHVFPAPTSTLSGTLSVATCDMQRRASSFTVSTSASGASKRS